MKRIASIILSACIGGATLSAQESKPVFFDGQQDSTVSLPFAKIEKDRVVGAVSTITGEQLSKNARNHVITSMLGQVAGLYVTSGTTAPGSSAYNIKVRGLSRGNNGDGPLIVIDGMAGRDINTVTVEEIETIEVLKDITAKMLYGSKAANGVIMITTKRGSGETKYSFDVEYGIRTANSKPQYLNSYEYATVYNQALAGDGVPDPAYDEEALNGYYSTVYGEEGADPIKYPNVDFYDEFMGDQSSFYRANVQVQGKKKQTSYFLNLGYLGEDGLQTVGPNHNYNRLNLRSNLDYEINEVMSSYLDVAARWDLTDRPNMAYGDYVSALSSHRALDYPLFVGTDSLGYGLGLKSNLYGDLTNKGYASDQNSLAQTNIGLKFDFNRYVAGLTAKAFISYDVYNALSKGKTYEYSRYRLNDDGTFEQVGVDNVKGAEQKFSDNTWRNFGGTAQIDYNYRSEKHVLNTTALFNIQQKSYKTIVAYEGTNQDDKHANFGLRANYAYDNRYVIEGDASLMGSDKFAKANRWGLFGAVGAAWNISNEAFMKDVTFINDLKLKGSYGLMGYDTAFDPLLYADFYIGAGSLTFGPSNKGTEWGFKVDQIGNPSLTFEKSREANIGLEGRLIDNRLSFEANIFDEYRYDMPAVLNTQVPLWLGMNGVVPTSNYNAISNKGFEVAINWADRVGDFSYQIGANVSQSEAIYAKLEESYEYEHLYKEGTPVDASWGYKSDGLYQTLDDVESDIFVTEDGTEKPLASSFGTIRPGDVKLLENPEAADGELNSFDQTILGNWFPRFYGAINLNLAYKGFSLYALAQGYTGCDRFMNQGYFTNQSGTTGNYSVNALYAAVYDPDTEAIQEGALYPRISTVASQNGVQSDFWKRDGSYAKLRTVQLAYDFQPSICNSLGAQGLQVYVKGDDLLTLSPISDMNVDPENVNAGIWANPLFTTVSVGVKLVY